MYPCWHLGQAHQTSFKAYACGYLVITLSSIDCPAGTSALTLGLMSSGVAEVEAERAFVLVSATPEVSLKSWDKHLSASKYHSFQSRAKKQEREELTFPLGSCLGPAYCTEPLFDIDVSMEQGRLFAGLLKCGWVFEFTY